MGTKNVRMYFIPRTAGTCPNCGSRLDLRAIVAYCPDCFMKYRRANDAEISHLRKMLCSKKRHVSAPAKNIWNRSFNGVSVESLNSIMSSYSKAADDLDHAFRRLKCHDDEAAGKIVELLLLLSERLDSCRSQWFMLRRGKASLHGSHRHLAAARKAGV